MQVRERFVGRRAELDELHAAIDTCASGRGGVVLLAGEPGIGKTRLTEVAADHARDGGCAVRWARCWEGPAAPFWPWTQLVRGQLQATGEAPPNSDVARVAGDTTEAPEGDAELVRFALFDAVTTFFRSSAAESPLVLVLDDLHWADVPSLRLLEFFAYDVRDAGVLVIGTFRDVEVDAHTETGRLLGTIAERATVLQLEGLRATEVAELLAVTSGSLAQTDFARVVHAETAGNPLFIRELARLLRAQGKLPGPHQHLPEGVHAVIRRRLARLSQPSNALLTAAAVLGPEFSIAVVAQMSGVEPDLVLHMLGEAESARLIVANTDAVGRYSFSHALIRNALYDALPLSRRIELHGRAGRALEGSGRLDEVAHHYVEAAPGGYAAKALSYSLDAGRRAVDQLAYETAATIFERAMHVLDFAPDDDKRAELLLELGDAHLRSGNMPAARSVFEAAAELARVRRRAEDLARAALGFGAGLGGFEIQIHDAKQIELLEEALEALPGADSPLHAWLAARLSVAVSIEESIEHRRDLSGRAIAIARRVGERRALAYALAAHCDAIAGPDHLQARLGHTTEIIAIAREERDRPLELLGYRMRIVALLESGDMPAVQTDVESFARAAERIRQPLYVWYVSLWHGMQALLSGQVDEALVFADEAEAIGSRAHSTNASMLSNVLRSMALFNRGRWEEGRVAMTKLRELVPFELSPYMYVNDALFFGRDGRVRDGRAALAKLDDALGWIQPDAEWLPTLCQLSEAADALDERELAQRIYPQLLPYRSLIGVEGIGAALHGSIELHLGLLARTTGNVTAAREHFAAAIDANRRLGGPLLVARSQRELASVTEDETIAPRLRAESDATYRALGYDDLASAPAPVRPAGANVFASEGEFWTLTFDGRTIRMKDAKGLRDLAKLLARPGRELGALDLAADGSSAPRPSRENLHVQGHAGELLDEQARAAYKARLAELEEDIGEAEGLGDAARAGQARSERDAIAHELAAAYGLGGRARKAGDPAERARTTVTRRIREAMLRIEDVHPALGRHLRKSVRTGTFCSYDPETPVAWRT
jgi:tetratricopeptide (TPR) repeat protein